MENDADNSGEIDFDEFIMMMSKIVLQKERDPELYEAFKVFNQFEGTGIDAGELRSVMAKFKIEITE